MFVLSTRDDTRPLADLILAAPSDFTDEELTELALAADLDVVLDDRAVPISRVIGEHQATLSSWYMPAVAVARVAGWKRPVVIAVVCALVTLEALGLCSVFGQVVVG